MQRHSESRAWLISATVHEPGRETSPGDISLTPGVFGQISPLLTQ